jgi:5-oxoprolinase (ATP-hydrolysing)
MVRAFEQLHQSRFGFGMAGHRLIVEAISVEAVAAASSSEALSPAASPASSGDAQRAEPIDHAEARFDGGWRRIGIFDRRALSTAAPIEGPAMIAETHGTVVVEIGWHAELDRLGNLLLVRCLPRPTVEAIGTAADPVLLEVFNNLFMSIAEQMGDVLANTAQSVNIKERLDFSCALFDDAGNLVANAPHLPVHLGSMGESVRAVIRDHRATMRPGDSYVLNSPYDGGTHLPDITVVTPVFEERSSSILFFVASRGHHADIGGSTPGSMPPDSRTIEQEGILIDSQILVRDGRLRDDEIRQILSRGSFPARNPDQNLADLRAQVAANACGIQQVQAMLGRFGADAVKAYMRHVQDNAEEHVRRVIGRLRDGAFRCEMDDGATIAVAVRIDPVRREAVVDFSGTSSQRPGNMNAPAAITIASVLYVFRCLVDAEIPLNAGCLRPIRILIPEASMLAPRRPAAVVAGNVETSQVITDALFAALGVMAAAQGTMNNFTFGSDRYQYYETICGGSGAGAAFDGSDAVHTHMTNTRLTDPEVLEWRFPVRLETFAVRRGSGGNGSHPGGNGVVRRIAFLQPMTAAILSGRRSIPPFGLAGGSPAAAGRNSIERADGRYEFLGGTAWRQMAAGDRFIIETPGGGGYGAGSPGKPADNQ